MGSPADGGLGYTTVELCSLGRYFLALAGLRAIDVKAGQTVVVAPATGSYSGATVEVASAMGAKVVALGRNLEVLQRIADNNPRVNAVQLKNDPGEDYASIKKFGTIDAYVDISPGAANDSTHVRTCLSTVKQYGKVCLMGIIQKDIAIPYMIAVLNNLTIRGQYMFERDDIRDVIKMVETGVLRLGKDAGHTVAGEFKLEEFEKAIDTSEANPEAGKVTVFKM